MRVKTIQTKLIHADQDGEARIVEIARVSSSRKDKSEDVSGLLSYLIKNKHWSPFEHTHATIEITTSKAIAIQMLRHRSFGFQEFSQRYQDVSVLDQMFQSINFRRQAVDNRQSSTEVIADKELSDLVNDYLANSAEVYEALLSAGVARECARMILPVTTTTVLHMTGSLRSWIHFLAIRDDGHAQLEAQEIARSIKGQLSEVYPITAGLLWSTDGS